MATLRDVTFAAEAWLDLRGIVRYTTRRYGASQADVDEAALIEAARALSEREEPIGSRVHDGVMRRIHVQRRGRKASHILFYRVVSPDRVQIVRILHERTDFDRHLPRPTWL